MSGKDGTVAVKAGSDGLAGGASGGRARSASSRKSSLSGPLPSVQVAKERSSSLDGVVVANSATSASASSEKSNNNPTTDSVTAPLLSSSSSSSSSSSGGTSSIFPGETSKKKVMIATGGGSAPSGASSTGASGLAGSGTGVSMVVGSKKEKKKEKEKKLKTKKGSGDLVSGGGLLKNRALTHGGSSSSGEGDSIAVKERASTLATAQPILHFSTSSVPTVTHPDLPAQLDKFLVTEGMETAEALVGRLRIEDMSDVCSDMSTIFEAHGQTQRLIQWAVRKELATITVSTESTLFRQTGVATCLVSIECKRKGSEYLAALLRPFVHRICNEAKSMEVDPLRLRASFPEELENNQRRLIEASQNALDLIFASAKSFPDSLKHTFLIAHNEIVQKLPGMRWAAISNFFFLRFIAPALVSPKASGLYDGNPSPQALRSLMLISKTLSNAANEVTFGDKESYMTIMNEVILNNQSRMREFLESLISVDQATLYAHTLMPDSIPSQSDLHMARCRLLASLYSHRNAVLASLMSAPSPVPGWTPPTRLTSSGNNSNSFTPLNGSSEEKKNSKEGMPAINDNKSGEATLGEMLAQLLDAYRIHCPDWVSEEDKKMKKQVQDELLERFEEGLVSIMRPVEPMAAPSGSLLRLLLDVEKQRTKELEEELRIIKLKLNTETQAKRDLQLQILRGNNAPAASGQAPGWLRERQRVATQFNQMYDMLGSFKGRMLELERLVLNEAAEGARPSGGSDTTIAVPIVVSPRSSKTGKFKDPKKVQKRRSWNMKLNPLSNNI